MGSYVLRLRFASSFAGAALAAAAGLYFLQKDYKVAQEAISQQMHSIYESLDEHVSALENLKKVEPRKQMDAEE